MFSTNAGVSTPKLEAATTPSLLLPPTFFAKFLLSAQQDPRNRPNHSPCTSTTPRVPDDSTSYIPPQSIHPRRSSTPQAPDALAAHPIPPSPPSPEALSHPPQYPNPRHHQNHVTPSLSHIHKSPHSLSPPSSLLTLQPPTPLSTNITNTIQMHRRSPRPPSELQTLKIPINHASMWSILWKSKFRSRHYSVAVCRPCCWTLGGIEKLNRRCIWQK